MTCHASMEQKSEALTAKRRHKPQGCSWVRRKPSQRNLTPSQTQKLQRGRAILYEQPRKKGRATSTSRLLANFALRCTRASRKASWVKDIIISPRTAKVSAVHVGTTFGANAELWAEQRMNLKLLHDLREHPETFLH